jgi:hypothetical protein
MAVSPLSEVVRDAAENAELRISYGVHSYYNRFESHMATQVGAGVLYGHLTTGTRDSFINDEEVITVDTDTFLSANEQEEVIELLIGSAEDAGQEDLAGNLSELTSPTILAFGAVVPTFEDEDEEDEAWALGGLIYEEPSERLIGPEHRDKTPNQFGREFLQRGGQFYTVEPPAQYSARFQVALEHFAKKLSEEDGTDSQ